MTNTELAILGLIVEKPRHGYEIEQVIEERGMRDWTEIGFSSIYYILKKLEKEGSVVSQLDEGTGKGPARKVYRVTDKGQDAWYQSTLETLSQPAPTHSTFLLGLAGMPGIPRGEVVSALEGYIERLEEQRDHVRTRWEDSGDSLPLFLDGMFDYSITLIQAEMDWVTRFVTKLGNK
jgi:DNA-binding PadR family transcriptional regulator